MGHSKTRTNLAHKLKSKRSARIGVLILIGGDACAHHGSAI